MMRKNFFGISIAVSLCGILSYSPVCASPIVKPEIPSLLSGWRKQVTCSSSVFQKKPIPTSAQDFFHLEQLHNISQGENQKLAILSTGVSTNPRLENIQGIGDYLANGSGLDDCDGIGTAIAGIIAAQPRSDDKFVGVAPKTQILSLRISSQAYIPTQQNITMTQTVQNSVNTLAKGLLAAADNGAQTVLIPQSLCYAASLPVDTTLLKSAIKYVVFKKHVVIVTAAADTTSMGCSSGSSNQANILTVPAMGSPWVLSVGSISTAGIPSNFSQPSVFPTVVTIGEEIVSLSNNDSTFHGLANGFEQQDNTVSFFNGTSFASAYVAGLVVLIRSAYPYLNASQILYRLISTVHPYSEYPSLKEGYGTVDPVAALTWHLPRVAPAALKPYSIEYTAPTVPKTPLYRLITIGFGLVILLLTLIILAFYHASRVAKWKKV